MTVFDYVVIAVVAISLLLGLWRGVIGEVIALLAWGLGLFAAFQYGETVAVTVFTGIGDPALRLAAACVSLFVAVLVAMALIRMLIGKMVKALGLTLSDRLLGMVFGLARGALISLVLVALGGMTAAPTHPWWQLSMLAAPLETAVMAIKPMLPDDLAKRIRFS